MFKNWNNTLVNREIEDPSVSHCEVTKDHGTQSKTKKKWRLGQDHSMRGTHLVVQ